MTGGDGNKRAAGDRQAPQAGRSDDALRRESADLAGMLDIATSALIMVDKSGLIERVNRRAVELLGEPDTYLLGKPIALFITPDDQAIFFLNRSRIINDGGDAARPFEIHFKTRQEGTWTGRVHARPTSVPGQRLPGLLISVDDISDYREVVESRQIKTYALDLLYTILDDLSVWSPADIDTAITYTLEKIGLMTAADRVYVGLFHHRRTRFSITHEWLADGIASPSLQGVATPTLSGIMHLLKKRAAVGIDDVDLLPDARREAHSGFHAPGTRAMLFAPLSYGRTIFGIIGCDTVGREASWSPDNRRMILHIGDAIVGALLRRQTEKLSPAAREDLFRFIPSTAAPPGDAVVEYDGPIEVIDGGGAPDTDQWQISADRPPGDETVVTATLKDGQHAQLACRACYRQRVLDITEIRALGTRLKAICPCGQAMFIRIELRREHRKAVHLEGVFIRRSANRMASSPDEWGPITVCNLSRRGIGFRIMGRQHMQAGDRFRVKFSLDNTAGSVIQKTVEVISIATDTVGCRFVGQDPCDATIGFYMMT